MLKAPPNKTPGVQIEVSPVPESYARKNFQNIKKFLDEESPLNGFRFVEFTVSAANSNFLFQHSLGYTPRDVLVTRITGAGTVTFNYDKFTDKVISVTTTAACHIRAFIGTYSKDLSAETLESYPQPMSYYTNPSGNTVSEPVSGSASSSSSSTSSNTTSYSYIPEITKISVTGSGTYTTPSKNGVLASFLRVRMVGGGGGGGGATSSGTSGSDSTFGPYLTAGGGTNGSLGNGGGGARGPGGTFTFSASTNIIDLGSARGSDGQGGFISPGVNTPGSTGGATPFGGAGSGSNGGGGTTAGANTGSGGGGGAATVAGQWGAGGGGAGGYIHAQINGPLEASYSYTVGSGGTKGSNGGDGAAGVIIVEAFWI